MDIYSRYIGLGGPNDVNVRPPQRRGPVAWAIAAIVVAMVIAFLVVNRQGDVPAEEPQSNRTVTRPAP